MNTTDGIVRLNEVVQWTEAFPIIKQLHPSIEAPIYYEQLARMMDDGYQLFGLYEGNGLVAVAGVFLRVNFCSGKHVYISELVTEEAVRSKGYGEKLIQFVEIWAREQGAGYICLESALSREAAHRFYEEKVDYPKWCYSFRKEL